MLVVCVSDGIDFLTKDHPVIHNIVMLVNALADEMLNKELITNFQLSLSFSIFPSCPHISSGLVGTTLVSVSIDL